MCAAAVALEAVFEADHKGIVVAGNDARARPAGRAGALELCDAGILSFLRRPRSGGEAIRTMQDLEVSQIPVVRDGALVGTLHEQQVIDLLLHAPERRDGPVDEVMEDALPEVAESASLDEVRAHLVAGNAAVIVRRADGTRAILTKYDLIHGLAAEVRQ